MDFRMDEEMTRVTEAEPNSTSGSTRLLLEQARNLLRGSKRKSSPSPSCSINSPVCGGPKVKRMLLVELDEEVMKPSDDAERNRTRLSSSSVSKTDTLPLEMTLGGNRKLWEMPGLGLDEKHVKEFGNDRTGNNLTALSSSASCSVSSSFPVRIDGYRKRNVSESWSIVFPTSEDGHAWRKYGQKAILNSKFQRCYFRCAHKHDQGCKATKHVQKITDDPHMYRTTYFGLHNCQDTMMRAPQIITDADPMESGLFP